MILKTKLDIALFQRAGSYFTSGGCEWVAYTACQFACWLFLLYLANVQPLSMSDDWKAQVKQF